MPAFESTKFPETTGYIYSACAKRLKERKLLLGLTDAEIAMDLDKKIINRIINNRRSLNNRFLVPPAFSKPLVDKLKLKSDYELYWSDVEDEEFIETVFCNLITDILDESDWNEAYWDEPYWSKNSERVDLIEKVLLDYVPYAKIFPSVIQTYETVNANGDYIPISPLAYLNGGEHPSFSEHRQTRQNAIKRLFLNTRPTELFISFFQGTSSFSKIDKKLDAFVDKSLMPFMKDNLPKESSLGLRVHSIISADISNYVELGLVNSVRTEHGFDNYGTPEYVEILQTLTSAGREYISRIEELQAQLDALHQKEKFGR